MRTRSPTKAKVRARELLIEEAAPESSSLLPLFDESADAAPPSVVSAMTLAFTPGVFIGTDAVLRTTKLKAPCDG
jgi:hypothetical protein